ncbi:MAG TPA: hypothetical protein VGT82_14290 [Ktedonobacteraceae bacterium]|nr:hypothetical protein [Ktedonobacteraceae bacterium]
MNTCYTETTTTTMPTTLEHPAGLHLKKGQLDLVVLKLMAQRVYLTLHQLDQPVNNHQPLLYSLEERHGRVHRIALYRPAELLVARPLLFVGFISGKRHPLAQHVLDEIQSIDQKLVPELMGIEDILSYSSLELRTDRWYNLVIFTDMGTKEILKKSSTHTYAAYHLAPRYYEWIRLHNGVMPGGLVQQDLRLESTKYYVFPDTQQRPIMHKVEY